MAALMLVGIATVLLTPEPETSRIVAKLPGEHGVAAWFRTAVIRPFADFMTRPGWAVILLFVVLYKFGDALTGVMANPFYVAMGFTKIEVANLSKLVGFVATLMGVALGGIAADRWGLYRSLFVCGILTMLANSLYVVQAVLGHNTWMLATTIFTDNLAAGMGSAAFVAYLSSLCNVAFTATQYALFSSLAALPTRLLSAPAGWLSDHVSWPAFFFVTTLAALPGLTMVLWLMRRFPDAALPRKTVLAADD